MNYDALAHLTGAISILDTWDMDTSKCVPIPKGVFAFSFFEP